VGGGLAIDYDGESGVGGADTLCRLHIELDSGWQG
jgi:hypothetical protein